MSAFKEGLIALLKPICHYPFNFGVWVKKMFKEYTQYILKIYLIIENQVTKKERNTFDSAVARWRTSGNGTVKWYFQSVVLSTSWISKEPN